MKQFVTVFTPVASTIFKELLKTLNTNSTTLKLVEQVPSHSLPDDPVDDDLQEVEIDWTNEKEDENSEYQVLFLASLQEVQ